MAMSLSFNLLRFLFLSGCLVKCRRVKAAVCSALCGGLARAGGGRTLQTGLGFATLAHALLQHNLSGKRAKNNINRRNLTSETITCHVGVRHTHNHRPAGAAVTSRHCYVAESSVELTPSEFRDKPSCSMLTSCPALRRAGAPCFESAAAAAAVRPAPPLSLLRPTTPCSELGPPRVMAVAMGARVKRCRPADMSRG